MKQEIIKAEIGHTAAFEQLSADCMVEYVMLNYKVEMLCAFDYDELIEHMGGIDSVFDNNQEAAIEYVNNINGPDEE